MGTSDFHLACSCWSLTFLEAPSHRFHLSQCSSVLPDAVAKIVRVKIDSSFFPSHTMSTSANMSTFIPSPKVEHPSSLSLYHPGQVHYGCLLDKGLGINFLLGGFSVCFQYSRDPLKMYTHQEFPGSPVVRSQHIYCLGQGSSLVGELRSRKLCHTATHPPTTKCKFTSALRLTQGQG